MPNHGNWVDIGDMAGYLAQPAAASAPGIVMVQEIFGVNAAMRAKADDFAEAGFAVLVPDLFWRLQPRVDLGYTEEERKQGFGYMQRFDFKLGVADCVMAAEWLAARPECSGAVSFVGFCLGGKLAVLAGARYPGTRAVASFYGVKLDESVDVLRELKTPFQFHVGDRDAHIPAEAVDKVRAALAGKENAHVHLYAGAQHGFFNRMRAEVYAPAAAALAQSRTLEMLRKAAQ